MKFCFTILIVFVFSFNVSAQSPNIFSSPESIVDFLDGKTYIIPDYGMIKFEYNKSDTKRMKESRIKDGADDEMADLIFDVSIKRNQSRRRDKTGYKIEINVNLKDPENLDSDPNEGYMNSFMLARNVIYPIKGFPSIFNLFADGDLYYMKVRYKKMPFNEFKNNIINGNKFSYKSSNIGTDNATINYIKCPPATR
jgi:hypothetical protein